MSEQHTQGRTMLVAAKRQQDELKVCRDELAAAPIQDYPAEDQAFFKFWYGHMKDDVMTGPVSCMRHGEARYVWDAALKSAAIAAAAPTKCETGTVYAKQSDLDKLAKHHYGMPVFLCNVDGPGWVPLSAAPKAALMDTGMLQRTLSVIEGRMCNDCNDEICCMPNSRASRDELRAAISGAAPKAALTDDQIKKMARYLSDRAADDCGVHREDNWMIYGGEYVNDIKAALAVAGVKS